MTKQHFTAIAETIHLSFTHAPNPNVIITLAVNLADDFEKFNPNFNREKFLAVAIGEPIKIPSLPEGACVHNVNTWG